jgi:hypothetical protein
LKDDSKLPFDALAGDEKFGIVVKAIKTSNTTSEMGDTLPKMFILVISNHPCSPITMIPHHVFKGDLSSLEN